jgi:hypothetical protein
MRVKKDAAHWGLAANKVKKPLEKNGQGFAPP